MYHCGPTVYGTQHIGNLSMYVFTDILRRTLEIEGFKINQVINFTDFGHLTSDGDLGEDKMSVGLRSEGLEPTLENMHKLGHKYAEEFLEDIQKLNIETEGTHFPYASHYVPQQIELIETLEKRGYTYKTTDGIYFDVSQFPEYGRLGGVSGEKEESRIGENSEKKNQRDFALWKFGDKGWESPWGTGFPGWHIECSAMILALLGEQIDIHTGGIEHIPVHHNNEIAQSESATGKTPFSTYWLHRAHVQIDGRKIAKSEGNVVYLSEIIEKGYSPLALRYLFLLSHYRTPTNFTWEALDAAQNALKKLKIFMWTPSVHEGEIISSYHEDFVRAIENDLNTPEALAVVWNLIKDESISAGDKQTTLLEFDKILGLDLENNEFEIKNIPADVQELIGKREKARASKEFKKSDELRDEIEAKGFIVEDSPTGPKIERI